MVPHGCVGGGEVPCHAVSCCQACGLRDMQASEPASTGVEVRARRNSSSPLPQHQPPAGDAERDSDTTDTHGAEQAVELAL